MRPARAASSIIVRTAIDQIEPILAGARAPGRSILADVAVLAAEDRLAKVGRFDDPHDGIALSLRL